MKGVMYNTLFLTLLTHCLFMHSLSMRIEGLQMAKCDQSTYPVMVGDVQVEMNQSRFKISGTLATQTDLLSPIKATVSLKRNVWGIWVHVPCEKKLGSCIYEDLCDYSYPSDKPCPTDFTNSGVPCRCPIPAGNYTIKPTFHTKLKEASFLAGKYAGIVTVTHNNKFLSCYKFYFVLKDSHENDIDEALYV